MNLKQKLSKKLKKSGGFTLIEMLIVVAIIAILVAVSIPLVGSALEKARIATDQANERAAKGAAMVEYLTKGETENATYYYDAENGSIVASPDSISGYGQCSDHKGGYVKVDITAPTLSGTGATTTEMKVSVTWAGGTGGNTNPHNIDGTVNES